MKLINNGVIALEKMDDASMKTNLLFEQTDKRAILHSLTLTISFSLSSVSEIECGLTMISLYLVTFSTCSYDVFVLSDF